MAKKKKWLTIGLCVMAIYSVLRANSDEIKAHNQKVLQQEAIAKEQKRIEQELKNISAEKEIDQVLSEESQQEKRKAIPLNEQCLISKGILQDGGELINFLISPFPDLKKADPKKFSDRKAILFNPKLTEFKAKYQLPIPLFAEDEELLFYASNGKLAVGNLANELMWMINAKTSQEKSKYKENIKVYRNFIQELENAIKEKCK